MLTSAATASARPPSSRIAAAGCCASSSERSATITDAPSRAHIIAVARPLPIESLSPAFAGPSAPPPTINATLPVKRAMILPPENRVVHRLAARASLGLFVGFKAEASGTHKSHALEPRALLLAIGFLALGVQERAGFGARLFAFEFVAVGLGGCYFCRQIVVVSGLRVRQGVADAFDSHPLEEPVRTLRRG